MRAQCVLWLLMLGYETSAARIPEASYEEYDYSVFDVYSLHGAPYGGYSRATMSQIASLPLKLPNVGASEPSDNPLHMKIRDGNGVLHVCRVYHEDELESASLEESMFDLPRPKSNDEPGALVSNEKVEKAKDEVDILMARDLSTPLTEDDEDLLVDETMDRMEQFDGLCGQIHKGWWSYEWCHEVSVSQFHIALNAETNAVGVEDLTKLGKFSSSKIQVDLAGQPPNEHAEDVPELARVSHVYNDGDMCDETGKPRLTYVDYKCCSPRVMERMSSLLHRNMAPFEEKIASVLDLQEDPDQVCSYNMTICTPLLCGYDPNKQLEEKYIDENGVSTESIRGLLKRVLGRDCLISASGGWWTYEVCHGGSISQYHEEMGFVVDSRTKTQVSKKIIEDRYNLGEYDASSAEEYPATEEYRHVVNATNNEKGGTYFEVEYTGGNTCDDDKDVKDAAVVGGSKGSTGIQRASTVRYFCGPDARVTVTEDRTCHYLIRVYVPELCLHPLFKVPVSKKEVVKCLPVKGA